MAAMARLMSGSSAAWRRLTMTSSGNCTSVTPTSFTRPGGNALDVLVQHRQDVHRHLGAAVCHRFQRRAGVVHRHEVDARGVRL